VLGNIKAEEKVEIVKGGEVLGNIKTKALFIELGAVFDGSCEMVPKEKKVSILPPLEETPVEPKPAVETK
ncbi:MAG: polymer-forming cytoskeletal protein, partial [Nitrospinota bacterium]